MYNYAKAIKLYREKMFLTQTQLAKILGVTPITIVRWESGQFNPSMKMKKEIYALLVDAEIILEEIK